MDLQTLGDPPHTQIDAPPIAYNVPMCMLGVMRMEAADPTCTFRAEHRATLAKSSETVARWDGDGTLAKNFECDRLPGLETVSV